MRELQGAELAIVCGGTEHPPGENDDGSHSERQKAAEEAARLLTGVDHHCDPNGDGGYSCNPV